MNELIEAVVPEAIVPGGWGLALGVGVGVALLMRRQFRPVAKSAIKGYLLATEELQKATAGAVEGLQDLYAEVKAERQGAAASLITDIGQANP